MLALGLGWLADVVGSAVILGAFAAGLLVVGTPHSHEIEVGITRLGHFFVPLFFVLVRRLFNRGRKREAGPELTGHEVPAE